MEDFSHDYYVRLHAKILAQSLNDFARDHSLDLLKGRPLELGAGDQWQFLMHDLRELEDRLAEVGAHET